MREEAIDRVTESPKSIVSSFILSSNNYKYDREIRTRTVVELVKIGITRWRPNLADVSPAIFNFGDCDNAFPRKSHADEVTVSYVLILSEC